MRLMAHNVTGHVFDAGHDLAENVPDEMADVILSFLAGLRSPDAGSQTGGCPYVVVKPLRGLVGGVGSGCRCGAWRRARRSGGGPGR